MKLLKNILPILVMIYSFASSQIGATENEYKDAEGKPTHTTQKLTNGQEGSTLKQDAIKFYARNYRVINFVTVVVPMALCTTYGVYSLSNYVVELHQQQIAWRNQQIAQYNQQRERYTHNCMLIAKECNGTTVSWESCPTQLAQSACYNVLFDCVSRLCGWDLLFVPNPDNKSSQMLVNTNFNSRCIGSQ